MLTGPGTGLETDTAGWTKQLPSRHLEREGLHHRVGRYLQGYATAILPYYCLHPYTSSPLLHYPPGSFDESNLNPSS